MKVVFVPDTLPKEMMNSSILEYFSARLGVGVKLFLMKQLECGLCWTVLVLLGGLTDAVVVP